MTTKSEINEQVARALGWGQDNISWYSWDGESRKRHALLPNFRESMEAHERFTIPEIVHKGKFSINLSTFALEDGDTGFCAALTSKAMSLAGGKRRHAKTFHRCGRCLAEALSKAFLEWKENDGRPI